MSGITNTNEPWLVPGLKAVHLDRQQTDIIPARQFVEPPAQVRKQPSKFFTKIFDSARFDLLGRALRNYKGTLPVLITIDRHQNAPSIDASERLLGIVLLSRNTHPEHVHGSALVDNLQSSLQPHGPMPAICADHQIGTHNQFTLGTSGTHANHSSLLLEQIHRLGLHSQMKLGISSPVFGEKIKKVPLRHEGNKLCASRQVGEVRNANCAIADL